MTTYVTTETITGLSLELTEREAAWFAQDARSVPAGRLDEARRCWTIARRLGAQFSVNVDWRALGGKSDAQIAAFVDGKVAQHKRSAGGKAGKKALEAKYGPEAADRIIASKRADRR